jgi:hypothetical protein
MAISNLTYTESSGDLVYTSPDGSETFIYNNGDIAFSKCRGLLPAPSTWR